MRAVVVREPGDPSVLEVAEVDTPTPRGREIHISVAAAGVNRADISQRRGTYPSPAGSPPWPGLEVSGTVLALGDDAQNFQIGDRVCALLPGGGYAEQVVIDERLALPIPRGISLIDAGGLLEVAATVWSNVFMIAGLAPDETLLVHGGSSGIGAMAIQIAHARGNTVAVTAGSVEKLDFCQSLGADVLINYRTENFAERVTTVLGGADVILDPIGGSYLEQNVEALKADGRIANIGNLSDVDGRIDFRRLMRKRGTIHSTSLRGRALGDRALIVAAVKERVWPLIEGGLVRPTTFARFPLDAAAEAHTLLESSGHRGKVLLVVSDSSTSSIPD